MLMPHVSSLFVVFSSIEVFYVFFFFLGSINFHCNSCRWKGGNTCRSTMLLRMAIFLSWSCTDLDAQVNFMTMVPETACLAPGSLGWGSMLSHHFELILIRTLEVIWGFGTFETYLGRHFGYI